MQNFEAVSRAISILIKARREAIDLAPVWNLLNHAVQHLEREIKAMLADPQI